MYFIYNLKHFVRDFVLKWGVFRQFGFLRIVVMNWGCFGCWGFGEMVWFGC